MKSFLPLSLLFLLLSLGSCSKKEPAPHLFTLELNTLQHAKFSFADLKSKKGAVIIFLQPECPFCNSYGKTLRELDSMYQMMGIPLIGVVAGKNYPEDEITAYCEKNRLHFPLLLDPDFALQKTLNAIITPEAFLVSNTGDVIYRGLIDDWAYEIGKVRPMVTEHYLTDAVHAWVENKPITLDSTKAVGCYIE